MRISDWSSDVCSSDLDQTGAYSCTSHGRQPGRPCHEPPAHNQGVSALVLVPVQRWPGIARQPQTWAVLEGGERQRVEYRIQNADIGHLNVSAQLPAWKKHMSWLFPEEGDREACWRRQAQYLAGIAIQTAGNINSANRKPAFDQCGNGGDRKSTRLNSSH